MPFSMDQNNEIHKKKVRVFFSATSRTSQIPLAQVLPRFENNALRQVTNQIKKEEKKKNPSCSLPTS